MSNPLAIATVTATLRHLLTQVTADLPDATVTARAPQKARRGDDLSNQLNVFLYQTAPNAAWQGKQSQRLSQNSGAVGLSPLALNLYYFVTAYGRDDDDIQSHRLLGQAMSILHRHTVLESEEIKAALPGNTLYQQVEPIRIVPEALTPEEFTRLWSMFQAPYAISAAYQVSVILIECPEPAPLKISCFPQTD
ncbi:MAG: DUF4255 domain-containing protein [Cyanobacteria bacterium P01_A01_bin.17]